MPTSTRSEMLTPARRPSVDDDLQALARALAELAGAQACAPDHARVPGAELLLDRCRDLVATLSFGDGGSAGGRASSPEHDLARLAVGAGDGRTTSSDTPEWHDWFMTPGVRSTRRRR